MCDRLIQAGKLHWKKTAFTQRVIFRCQPHMCLRAVWLRTGFE